MAAYRAQILVCTNSKGTEDKRHCGDKGGLSVLEAFRQARSRLGLEKEVNISKTGCTGQHAANSSREAAVIVYGPGAELGGVWYKLTEADAEEVMREHIQNGRVVQRLVNPSICVNLKPEGA